MMNLLMPGPLGSHQSLKSWLLRRKILATISAVLVFVTGCAGGSSIEMVHGYYLDAAILGGGGCPTASHAQILAPSGKVLASPPLVEDRKGERKDGLISGDQPIGHIYTFAVRVPAGLSHYGVRISYDTKWFSEKQMTALGSPIGNSYAATQFKGVQLSCK